MKKSLFLAAAAIISFALASCDPQPGPTTDATITVNPAELTLSPGDQERLKAVVDPAGTSLNITWSSDNEAVATVSTAGLVTAVADGTATITASAEGAKAGTCVVTVSSTAIYEMYNLLDYGIFGDPEMVEGTERYTSLTTGDSVQLQLGITHLILWDGNCMCTESGWAGAGFITDFDAPVYWITANYTTEGQYVGYYISMSQIAAGYYPLDSLKQGCGDAGFINPEVYGQFIKSQIDYGKDQSTVVEFELLEKSTGGALISYVDATEDEAYMSINYGLYYGYVDKLLYELDENDNVNWAADIHWAEFVDDNYYLGFKCTRDEEGKVDEIVVPFEYKTIAKSFKVGFEGAAVAPQTKFELGDMKKVHAVDPIKEHKALSIYNFYQKF